MPEQIRNALNKLLASTDDSGMQLEDACIQYYDEHEDEFITVQYVDVYGARQWVRVL